MNYLITQFRCYTFCLRMFKTQTPNPTPTPKKTTKTWKEQKEYLILPKKVRYNYVLWLSIWRCHKMYWWKKRGEREGKIWIKFSDRKLIVELFLFAFWVLLIFDAFWKRQRARVREFHDENRTAHFFFTKLSENNTRTHVIHIKWQFLFFFLGQNQEYTIDKRKVKYKLGVHW